MTTYIGASPERSDCFLMQFRKNLDRKLTSKLGKIFVTIHLSSLSPHLDLTDLPQFNLERNNSPLRCAKKRITSRNFQPKIAHNFTKTDHR